MLQGLSAWNIISSLLGLIIIGGAIGVIVALVSKNNKTKAGKTTRVAPSHGYIAPRPPATAAPAPPLAPPVPPATALPTPDPAAALEALNDLQAKGLISAAEYTELRARIIDRI